MNNLIDIWMKMFKVPTNRKYNALSKDDEHASASDINSSQHTMNSAGKLNIFCIKHIRWAKPKPNTKTYV